MDCEVTKWGEGGMRLLYYMPVNLPRAFSLVRGLCAVLAWPRACESLLSTLPRRHVAWQDRSSCQSHNLVGGVEVGRREDRREEGSFVSGWVQNQGPSSGIIDRNARSRIPQRGLT